MSRARACWITGVAQAEIRELELPPASEGTLLVRTLYSAISRGTESLVFHGRVPVSEHERMRAPAQEGDFPFPVKYGYINVGRVEEGPAPYLGKTVFCLYPHQTHYRVAAEQLTLLPDELSPERAVLAAGMETAINALWDSEIKIGDRVLVVGAGVIGSLCAYLAARTVGTEVRLVDSNPARSSLANALDLGFAEPEECETGWADVVIHASASAAGLATALRCAGPEAAVVELSWYGDAQVGVALGQAFHSQRLRLRSSQVGTLPASQRARWSYQRRLQLALSLCRDARLDALISGESSFEDLPQTLAEVTRGPGPLCHRIRYPDE